MTPINVLAFRKSNKITQQQLADFLGTSKSFISLVESSKSKLPDDKIDKLMMEGRTERNWDIYSLNPFYYRLYELAVEYGKKSKSKSSIVFDWETGHSVLHISPDEMLSIKHGRGATTDNLKERIMDQFPCIDEAWLEYGVGTMYNENFTDPLPYDSPELYPQDAPVNMIGKDDPNAAPYKAILKSLQALETRIAAIEAKLGK